MRDLRVQVEDLSLQVRTYGRGAEAIVFLHFGGANLEMWAEIVPFFEGDYCLVLMDLRGHGRSDKPVGGYHIDQMAGDVGGVLDCLGIDRTHVVGSSLGAEVGLSLAANEPGKVISLVADGALHSEYGPFGTWEGSEEDFRAHVAIDLKKRRGRPDPTFASLEAFVDSQRQLYEQYGCWNETVEAMVRYGVEQMDNGAYIASWHKPATLAYMAHYNKYRFEDYYRRLQCPVLMVSDEEDAQDERYEAAMTGLAELAGAEIVTLPGWVHPFGWMLTPEAIARVVLDFYARMRQA